MRLLFLPLIAFLGACTTTADIVYHPAVAPVMAGPPAIHAVTATDNRKDETDPTYVGSIRGGFGNPLKTIKTAKPIADEVRDAFQQALVARGLFGPTGQDTLSVQVTAFNANQIVGPFARAAFDVQLRNAGGQVVYQDTGDAGGYAFTFFSNGILASSESLRAFMEEKMTAAIDQAVDKPGFVAAVKAAR